MRTPMAHVFLGGWGGGFCRHPVTPNSMSHASRHHLGSQNSPGPPASATDELPLEMLDLIFMATQEATSDTELDFLLTILKEYMPNKSNLLHYISHPKPALSGIAKSVLMLNAELISERPPPPVLGPTPHAFQVNMI